MKKKMLILVAIVIIIVGVALYFVAWRVGKDNNDYYFPNADRVVITDLRSAIDNDDSIRIESLIKSGVNPNIRFTDLLLSPSALEYAVAQLKKNAVHALLKNGADPNLRDEGFFGDQPRPCSENAVTIAVEMYKKDPEYFQDLLVAGGDPNTKRCDNDPIIIRFINDRNLSAIRYLKENGADIDMRNRSENPLIIYAGIIEYWDVVWTLLDLGAKYDYEDGSFTMVTVFNRPRVTPPDSPLWQYKAKSWQYLRDRGIKLPPLQ